MLAAAILLGVIIVVQLVVLAWITARQAGNLLELAGMQQQERAEHRSEIGELLQRIQAPDVAVVQHQIATAPPEWSPPSIPFEDDEAFHQTREDLSALLNESGF